jgi:hypothetical protein
MIHHETISAKSATEDCQWGRLDILEDSHGLGVYDCYSGLYVCCCETMSEAIDAATKSAENYDKRWQEQMAGKGECE